MTRQDIRTATSKEALDTHTVPDIMTQSDSHCSMSKEALDTLTVPDIMTQSDARPATSNEASDTPTVPDIMTRSDFHVHTCYCDGKDSPEDIVKEAVRLGMTRLGFSGHSYTAFDTIYCMSPDGTRSYMDEIHRLKDKYSGQIELLCGIERDYYSDIDTGDFDYVIGSVHYVNVDGEFLPVDESLEAFMRLLRCCHDDPCDMAGRYYSLVADVVNKTGADIIGHFDLITKFNEGGRFFDEDSPGYIEAWKSAADSLLQTGRPFEINTGAISRGWRKTPYPSAGIISYIASRGGKFILSSDSHSKDTLMFQFAECEELARNLGLTLTEL